MKRYIVLALVFICVGYALSQSRPVNRRDDQATRSEVLTDTAIAAIVDAITRLDAGESPDRVATSLRNELARIHVRRQELR